MVFKIVLLFIFILINSIYKLHFKAMKVIFNSMTINKLITIPYKN